VQQQFITSNNDDAALFRNPHFSSADHEILAALSQKVSVKRERDLSILMHLVR